MPSAKAPRRDMLPPLGRGPWAIGFVALALVALAVIPAVLGQRATEAQRFITDVLDPARTRAATLSLIQAQQRTRFQAFLLTGERASNIEPYNRALLEEQRIHEELDPLVRAMGERAREPLAAVSALAALTSISTRWHVGHQVAFSAQDSLSVGQATLATEQAIYADLRRATTDLEDIIRSEMDAGRRRMDEIRVLQTRISLVLVLLALGSTLVVGLVGRQLRGLTAEAEARRQDAVRARREIDALLEATGDGVIGIDLDGRCLSMNRVGSELLGYTEMEIRGRDLHDTIYHSHSDGTPRDRDDSPILQALRSASKAGSDDDVLWRRKGIPFPARWALRPLVDGTELRGGVLTFADMTAVKEHEEALQRAVRARDEVVSIVSHDLRNPLGVVAAAADILLDLPLDEGERRNQASIIARSAGRMSRLIEDLLDVARIEAGALVVRTAPEAAAPILEELGAIFHEQARERGVSLHIDTDPDTPQTRADRDRVMQAMSNLVVNALKFTPEGGTVRVQAAGENGSVAFAVSDDGPGIPEAMQDRLFERFWQAERHGRTGSGLGLAIVRGIAEAHGGSVRVESREGEGASFVLLLPVATSEEPT